MGTHEVSTEQPQSAFQGPSGGPFGCWNQQGGFLQLPGLHELTPLNSHLISPVLAQALGLPPSDGEGTRPAAGAQNGQHAEAQQPQQPSSAQFQQMQHQAAQQPLFQDMPRLMQSAGYDAAQNRQNFAQQYPAGPSSGQGYPSGTGMQHGIPQNGGATAGYSAFQHANLYGFNPATAMANPYNLGQFQGFAQQQQQPQQQQQQAHAGWGDPTGQGMGATSIKRSQQEEPKATSTADDVDDNHARALKRPRLVWTAKLHQCFVAAVEQLGLKNAVPKTIMQLMHVDGLTRENVASHLQKYRLQLKKENKLDEDGNLIVGAAARDSGEPGSSNEHDDPETGKASSGAAAAAAAEMAAAAGDDMHVVPQMRLGSKDGAPEERAVRSSCPG